MYLTHDCEGCLCWQVFSLGFVGTELRGNGPDDTDEICLQAQLSKRMRPFGVTLLCQLERAPQARIFIERELATDAKRLRS